MSVPSFKDLNKSSADLLEKGFPSESAWEIVYKPSSDLKFVSSTKKEKDQHFAHSFESNFTCPKWGLAKFTFKQSPHKETPKSESHSGHEETYAIEVSSDKFVDHLKVTGNASYDGSDHSGSATVAYTLPDKALIEVTASSDKKITTQVSGKHERFLFGVTGTVGVEEPLEPTGYGIRFGYVPNASSSLVAYLNHKKDEKRVGISTYYNAEKYRTKIATDFSADTYTGSNMKFGVALERVESENLTLKAKYCGKSHRLHLAAKQRINDTTSVTFGVASEVGHPSEPQVGFQLNLEL